MVFILNSHNKERFGALQRNVTSHWNAPMSEVGVLVYSDLALRLVSVYLKDIAVGLAVQS